MARTSPWIRSVSAGVAAILCSLPLLAAPAAGDDTDGTW